MKVTKFKNIYNSLIEYYPVLKSKRALDNFIIKKYILDELEKNKKNYEELINNADENKSIYNKYLNDYFKLEKYTTIEEFQSYGNIHMKFKTFIKIENQLFINNKLNPPITEIAIHCHPTYTSPTGRNHYFKDQYFYYNEIKYLLLSVNERMEQRTQEMLLKEENKRIKREKEKKLRELDKYEQRLKEKEKELNIKEKEFLDATKDQLYSTDSNEIILQKKSQEINEELTISQKLKILKNQFENGEITFEEYQSKRKDLI